jgi:hypothetical protein
MSETERTHTPARIDSYTSWRELSGIVPIVTTFFDRRGEALPERAGKLLRIALRRDGGLPAELAEYLWQGATLHVDDAGVPLCSGPMRMFGGEGQRLHASYMLRGPVCVDMHLYMPRDFVTSFIRLGVRLFVERVE